ncbi:MULTISPECIES: hypothetical protein [unclassified Streptomyces]|uniref:hypothetical protein n=1 Tax=unclassified Streptomyces TaxID=2593676 RepID=UPI00093B4198|nr:hypothetical protein [Streptomyces sp. CB02058]OKI88900.1 hypothetical protein AMK10_31920 [Streptomyces sp. CB02058]
MTVPDSTSGGVAATTALLQAELPRLEEQQQTLEKDLASVTARLSSVRSALTALQALSAAPPLPGGTEPVQDAEPQPTAPAAAEAAIVTAPEASPQEEKAPAPAGKQDAPSSARGKARKGTAKRASGAAAPRKRAEQPAKKAQAEPAKPAKPAKAAKAAKAASAQKAVAPTASAPAVADGGSLTEQVMEVVAASGHKALRARDVTEALGRELTAGSINTVRSTLDRLVATSRAHRAGRGLYQAPRA